MKPPPPIAWILPWMLLSVRVILTPIVLLSPNSWSDRTILWLYALAFATDYLDGAAARRLGTATPLLRKADSSADLLFHLTVAVFILRRHPLEFANNKFSLALFIVSTVTWYTVDAVRWHRLAGYHAYSAKILAVALMVWMAVLLGGWRTGHLLAVVLIWGTASNIEGLLITAALKRDRADVRSFIAALRDPGFAISKRQLTQP